MFIKIGLGDARTFGNNPFPNRTLLKIGSGLGACICEAWAQQKIQILRSLRYIYSYFIDFKRLKII